MNKLQIFKNPAFGQVRVAEVNGEPWFVGKDVATILGYMDTNKAVAMHVDDEDKLNDKTALSLGQRGGWIINESGLYSLILSSKLPTAKAFKRWVTSEVLPTIRKHGAYMTEQTLEKAMLNPDYLLQLATALKTETDKRKALEASAVANAPKVLFADAVGASRTSILVGELAKLLRQNGVDTGEKRLFQWLRDNGYLIRRQCTDYNMPTQKSMEAGLFEIKETVVSHADGHISVSKTPKVTGKGQIFFVKKFLGKEIES